MRLATCAVLLVLFGCGSATVSTQSAAFTPEEQAEHDSAERVITSLIEKSFVCKVSADRATLWINPLKWKMSNRDEKELFVKVARVYAMTPVEKSPFVTIKSFADDATLAEISLTGSVQLRR